MSEPRYAHDCDNCTFLGTFGQFDLYFCTQGGAYPTAIARFGSDGPEYISGLVFADTHDGIAEARKRAIERGLLGEPDGNKPPPTP